MPCVAAPAPALVAAHSPLVSFPVSLRLHFSESKGLRLRDRGASVVCLAAAAIRGLILGQLCSACTLSVIVLGLAAAALARAVTLGHRSQALIQAALGAKFGSGCLTQQPAAVSSHAAFALLAPYLSFPNSLSSHWLAAVCNP